MILLCKTELHNKPCTRVGRVLVGAGHVGTNVPAAFDVRMKSTCAQLQNKKEITTKVTDVLNTQGFLDITTKLQEINYVFRIQVS